MCEIEEQPSMANKQNNFRSHQVSARHFNETKQVRDSQPIKPNQEKSVLYRMLDLSEGTEGTEREARRRHLEHPLSAQCMRGGVAVKIFKCSQVFVTGDKRDVTPCSETDAVTGKAHKECPSYPLMSLRAAFTSMQPRLLPRIARNIAVAQSALF